MGDMSEEQERALEQFRKYIKDNNITDHPQYDDYYLLRFLRARKFDMEKTILMFTTFMDWRKENDVDNILEVRAYIPLNLRIPYRSSSLKSTIRFSRCTLTSIIRQTRRAVPSTSNAWVSSRSMMSSS
jgi:hypothetical protein